MHKNSNTDVSAEWVKIRFGFLFNVAQTAAYHAQIRLENLLREIQEIRAAGKPVYKCYGERMELAAKAYASALELTTALEAAQSRVWGTEDIIQLDSKLQ